MDEHLRFMQLALKESQKALPGCLPNPPVGCVLVRDGIVISKGYTQQPGACHAEAHALAQLQAVPAGVSAYVTLEPCSFFGRTPSCAQALVKSGIETVYIGITDPDPRNSGKGIDILRESGIQVILDVLSMPISEFLSPYLIKGN
jgi:pyrimidine deaminase RibD-like protein